MIALAIISIVLCIVLPLIGWLLFPKKHSLKKHIDISITPVDTDVDKMCTTDKHYKSLSKLLDTRWTNIFRPWGGDD